MRLLTALLLLASCLLAAGRTAEEKAAMQKAIRMKTSNQLKNIFEELKIDYKGLDKEGLRKKAYKEDAVRRWEELHPEKKRKAPKAGVGGANPFGKPPDGMDPTEWENLMRKMKGDFSHETDPERRRILEKLSRKGMSLGGGTDMDIEQLRNMEKMMDGLGDFGKNPGMGGMGDLPTERDTPSPGDEDVADEDKMEL